MKGYVFRLYPSDKQIELIEKSFGCSRCGYKETKVKDLNVRKWECPSCTSINERDINSSINIMFEGIKRYMKELIELQVS